MGARLAVLFSVLLLPAFVFAQDYHSDLTLSGLGNFPFHSSGGNVSIDGTNSGGGAINYRFYFKTHSAIEAGYGYTHGTFYYAQNETSVGGGIITLNQTSAIHELTAAYVYHFWDDHRFKPFVEAGGGGVIFKPGGSNTANSVFGAVTQARGAYLFGGGLDYRFKDRFSLRMMYRMLSYKAPDFFGAGLTTHSWMRTSAPQIGVTYRF